MAAKTLVSSLKVGVGEAGEVDLFALEVGVEVDEGGLVGLEDAVHVALLIGVEVEFVGGAVVVPPAAAEAELEAHAGLAVGVDAGAIEVAGVAGCVRVHAAPAHHAAGMPVAMEDGRRRRAGPGRARRRGPGADTTRTGQRQQAAAAWRPAGQSARRRCVEM